MIGRDSQAHILSFENQFVVPPLGGSVSYKFITRYQMTPPKGGTANSALCPPAPRLARGCANLQGAKRVDRLHSAPRSLARTHRPACPPSTPDRRLAMPLPHNLHGQ